MSLRYEISTNRSDDGLIFQKIDMVCSGVRETVVRQVINTQDQQIRDQLIALGWTPPAKESPMKTCKTCKHWGKIAAPRLDALGDPKATGGYCRSDKLTEDVGIYASDMLVYDYSESGGFWTGADFGCVNHTP